MTLEWIQDQIENAMNASDSPQNVRDFALLCIARQNIKEMQKVPQTAKQTETEVSDFQRACRGCCIRDVLSVIDRHMQCLQIMYPSEYLHIINEIEKRGGSIGGSNHQN